MKLLLLLFVILSFLFFIGFVFRRIKKNRFRFKALPHVYNHQDRLPKISLTKRIKRKIDAIRSCLVKIFSWVIYITGGIVLTWILYVILASLENDGGEDLFNFIEFVISNPFYTIRLILNGLVSLMGASRLVFMAFIAIFILWRILGTKKKNLKTEQ